MATKQDITLAIIGERLKQIDLNTQEIKENIEKVQADVTKYGKFMSAQKVLNWINGTVLIAVLGSLIKMAF